jgi:class 3 adenylate cyclase/tetratricopeptide (TPR) repeat protein
MTFEEILDQAIAMLQRRGRLTYGTLKRQFQLDDAALEDLTNELIEGQRVAVDERGNVLVWTGGAEVPSTPSSPASQPAQPFVPQHVHRAQVEAIQAIPPPDAERRQLTVLFCDLVDSTTLSGQLDPEDLREVIRAYQQVYSELITRFDGHIAQLLGDGLLVYFGYPHAHEDDAQRAARTGLGMLAALGDLNTRLKQDKGIQLAIRVGIHTGLVVVGAMGGQGRQEQLALGETPNIAARIQGLAQPNTVAISDATYRLVQGYFDCEALGAQTLRGVTEPIVVYRVLSASGAQSRLDIAQPRGLTPLVGRDAEVTLLRERWEQVKAGQGHVVLLTGEAGIGKSRLVQMLKDHVAHEPHVRWECRSTEYSQNSALFPLLELFQRLLRFQAEDTPDEKFGKLAHALGQYSLPVEESVQLFAPLLALPIPENHYPPLNLSPQRQRQKTLETIVAILCELAEHQPVLFIVEDLHWTDPSTLELLNLVIDQTPTASLLVLLTCRPHFQPAWHHRSYLTEITVHHLSHAQGEQMVTGMTEGKTFPAAVLQQILDKTDGVPLFVEEITTAILESGHLTDVDGRYELAESFRALTIPTTLHDSLMARLDRLVTAKAVAQYAAVIGRQFSYALLQASSQVDEAMLQHDLRRLVEAELLYQRGLPPQSTCVFKHALIQDAAYESLLKSTRQQYHQRITQVLEAQFPETAETQPELLAQHYTAAGLHAQALSYWQRAGQRALERSAHREAVGCFEQALSTLPHLPETRGTREQAIDLRLAMRSALQPLGRMERLLAYLHEAESLAETLNDSHRLGQVLAFLSVEFYFRCAYDQAITSGQRALALTTASGDVVLHALANQYLGFTYHDQSDYRRAIDCLRQTVAFFDGAGHHERFGQIFLPAVNSRAWLATCQAELGTFAEGNALAEEGLRIAEAVAHPASLLIALWGLGLLSLRQGDLPRALPPLEQAMSICQDADLPFYFPRIAAALGEAYTLAGRVGDAVPLLTQGIERAIATGREGFQALCRLPLGEAHLLAGRLENAHALAEHTLAFTRAHQERGNEAYALRLLGDIAARREPPDLAQAEAYYQHALALTGELGMRPLQAHCHHSLGTLYRQTGRAALARAALSTAIELYRAMDMTFWLPQAKAALAQVERP